MREIKDTKRAEVHIGYDGRVHKRYRGSLARKRYDNEVRVLKYLETKGCTFVPKLLHSDPDELYIITTNCGQIVPHIGQEKMDMLFAELETYGVRHGDAFARNITYSSHEGRFCIIDFEFSTILESGEGLTLAEAEKEIRKTKFKI
ncbi:MAG: serine/threonine protein phosphatase [Verrucomicrobia bacterium]|nr:serine/threonine protein phosphatase [Verrucomicrobiota bacterium]MDA1069643.1 serine/threonine protein phosphatase [Verrucomicrobiota bacterium]